MAASSPERSPRRRGPTPRWSVLSVRIVSLDYYMALPLPGFYFSYSHFHGEVPVIRIYGSTPAGQKTCLHIHLLRISFSDDFKLSIECVLASVLSVSDAVKMSFHFFMCLAQRTFITSKKVSALEKALQDGAVLNRVFQPYESHIPYLLHFLIDYNLYGMGYVHVTDFKFRPPLPDDFHPKSSPHSKVDCSTESGHKELEYFRLLEEAKPVDMGRPLWDAVLRSFLHESSEQISVERNNQCPVSSSAAQRTTSQLFEEHEKRVDAEALVLLSWLASSQAAEEPTTDDELISYRSSVRLDESSSLSNNIPRLDGSSDENQEVPQEDGGAMPTEKEPSASFMSRTGKNSHATTDNTDRESFCRTGEHDPLCDSVRDLMRRRISFRF
uniref:DNA polymerase zeta catalytic subunit N-terminal domain-containing protein n=1 Tax=Oryza punctata TaxID=4537 RepID=A0A0E0LIF0_ORYPU